MLDVRRMHVLRAVVTSGSMTAAATHLGYTASAVSQQIAALESEAGIALLERTGRGVRPTAAGRLLSEHAAVIGRSVAEAETALAELRSGRTGRIALRFFPSVGAPLVAPAVARFRREQPGLRIDLAVAEPDAGLRDVETGEADLALMVGSRRTSRPTIPGRDAEVQFIQLAEDPYVAVLPSAHCSAANLVVDLSDLRGEPWVGSEPAGPCLDPILDACGAAGFTPAFAVETQDYATAQGLVAAGLGVGVMPRLGIGLGHPGVAIRRLRNPEPVRAIHVAARAASLTQPGVRALVMALRDASMTASAAAAIS